MSRHTNKFSTSQEKHTNRSSHEKRPKCQQTRNIVGISRTSSPLVLMFFIASVLGLTLSIVRFHICVLIVQLGVPVQQRNLFMHNLHRRSLLLMGFIQKTFVHLSSHKPFRNVDQRSTARSMGSSLIWFLKSARISLGRGCRNLRSPYKVKVPWFTHLRPVPDHLHQWVIKDPYIATGQKFSKFFSPFMKIRIRSILRNLPFPLAKQMFFPSLLTILVLSPSPHGLNMC